MNTKGISMKLWVLLSVLLCAACSDPPATPPSISKGQDVIVVPDFTLSRAPPSESLLDRWKRTKADYERLAQVQRNLENQVDGLDMPAFVEYRDAEKALQEAQCGKVCLPTDPH